MYLIPVCSVPVYLYSVYLVYLPMRASYSSASSCPNHVFVAHLFHQQKLKIRRHPPIAAVAWHLWWRPHPPPKLLSPCSAPYSVLFTALSLVLVLIALGRTAILHTMGSVLLQPHHLCSRRSPALSLSVAPSHFLRSFPSPSICWRAPLSLSFLPTSKQQICCVSTSSPYFFIFFS